MSPYPDPRVQSGGYGQQPQQYVQAQPYYPAQAPVQYAQPAYPYPPGYGPMPAYYAPPPDHTKSTIAGVMWILCLVRDLLYLLAVLAVGSMFGGFSYGMGGILVVLAIFPLIGVIGSAVAMMSDFQRTNYQMGTVGAVLALIGSSFPGIILVGPVGLVLSIVGLVLHISARPEFSS